MIDLKSYESLRGTGVFKLTTAEKAEEMKVEFDSYNTYTGARTKESATVNVARLKVQRDQLVMQRDRMNEQIKQLDNFIADCEAAK